MKTLLLSLFFGFWCLSVFAQDEECTHCRKMTLKDPLRDPEIWQKLEQSPINMKLWQTYFKKEEKDWNKEDVDKMRKWKQILMLRKISGMDNFRAFSQKHETYYTQYGIFISDWNYEKIMESKGDTAVLNKMIAQNPEKGLEMYIFTPIPPEVAFEAMEKYFAEIFTIFGKTYITYQDRPARASALTKKEWVELHTTRLKIISEVQFRKIINFLEK